ARLVKGRLTGPIIPSRVLACLTPWRSPDTRPPLPPGARTRIGSTGQRLEQGKLAAGGRRDEAATEGGDPRPRPEGGGQGGLQTGRGHVVGHVMEVPARGGRLHEAVVPTGKVVRQRGVDLGRGNQFAVGAEIQPA